MSNHVGRDLEATWGRVLVVWWLVIWRAAIIGTLAVLVLGWALGFVMGAMGLDLRTIDLVGQVAAMAIYGLAVLITLRMALKKRYADFQIALVPPEG
ncbi:MAG: hypothetical protein QNJ30_04380 [Kiloniellales bacterium]|nr:hypothetical protein [Kiloniellales bacterium]